MDSDASVRASAASALGRYPLPSWAIPIVHDLLDDANSRVRGSAVSTASYYRGGKGANPFVGRLREILDSPEEDEHVRSGALVSLLEIGALDDDDLAALARDPNVRVAEKAKRYVEMRARDRANQYRPE